MAATDFTDNVTIVTAEWLDEADALIYGGADNAFTTAELEDISNAVNTSDKKQFKIRGNSTTGRLVYSAGSAAGALWLFFDGTTAHTPV